MLLLPSPSLLLMLSTGRTEATDFHRGEECNGHLPTPTVPDTRVILCPMKFLLQSHIIVLHQYNHAATSDQKVIDSTSVLSSQCPDFFRPRVACLAGGFFSVFFNFIFGSQSNSYSRLK